MPEKRLHSKKYSFFNNSFVCFTVFLEDKSLYAEKLVNKSSSPVIPCMTSDLFVAELGEFQVINHPQNAKEALTAVCPQVLIAVTCLF